ncbi:ADP-ribosylglycohydrolase family protein [Candidatus Pacearchaeota archaeon]|nr:ADP-ribosylglycohydrolase family protein [Candidatus Pacearchaeota archaeon]
MMNKKRLTFIVALFFSIPVFSNVSFEDGVLGAVFGCAIGDAMGRPTEFLNMKQICDRYPKGIKSFGDFHTDDFWKDKNGNSFAPYTDDTAMAKLVLQVLVGCSFVDNIMPCLSKVFVKDMNTQMGWAMKERAPGNACLRGVKKLEKRLANGIENWKNPWWNFWKKNNWWDVGEKNAGGCGSVMRVFPFGLVFAHDIKLAELLAVEHSKLTHGAPIALAACAAMAVGTAYSLKKEHPNIVVEKMIEAAKKYDKKTAGMIRDAADAAHKCSDHLLERGVVCLERVRDASQLFFEKYQGWAAHEAIAAATYVYVMFPDNIKGAIYLGVHTPGDSDSIACMAGALVGARVGLKSVPSEWVSVVENSQELMSLGKLVGEKKYIIKK